MNERQRRAFDTLKARVVCRTCVSKVAEVTKAEAEHAGRHVLFHIAAEAGIFHGTVIGLIGPRGGVTLTYERYDFY